jgi:hypothetical protein
MAATHPTAASAATADDRKRDDLLRRYGIEITSENRAALDGYAARTRRSRWWGVVGALGASFLGLFGTTGHSLGQNIAWIMAGYLVGSAVAEVLAPQRRSSGAVRTASLAMRQPSLLLPFWAQVLPWVCLLPCLLAPLLLLGHHQVGVTRVHDRSGSAMGRAAWFSSPALLTIAVLAAAALVLWWLTLRQLSRRRLPVDSLGAACLDVLTRALSARAVSGASAALGLSLLAGLAYLGVEPSMSRACTSPTSCHYLYSWHARYDLLQNVGFVLIVAAVLIFWFSRLPRVDPERLRSAVGLSR